MENGCSLYKQTYSFDVTYSAVGRTRFKRKEIQNNSEIKSRKDETAQPLSPRAQINP